MKDAVVHVTLSRELWEAGVDDAWLGRLLRQEVATGLERLEARSGESGRVKHIEVELIDPSPPTRFWCDVHQQDFDGTRHGGFAYCVRCEREGGPNA